MEMWGVAFEETLQLLCAGMRETRSCFIYLFFILYFFPNSDHPFSCVLQLLSTHDVFIFGWKLEVEKWEIRLSCSQSGENMFGTPEHHKHLLMQI